MDGGWDTREREGIIVGRRRQRTGRRRKRRPALTWTVTVVILLAVIGGGGTYFWTHKPKPTLTLPSPSIVAPGGFQARTGPGKSIAIGLEIRNATDVPLTVVSAQITPPRGLTQVALAVFTPGPDGREFTLDDLPSAAPVALGTGSGDRNAFIAARFTVDCAALPPADEVVDEAITVRVSYEGRTWEDELTPPAVDDTTWLVATAARVCGPVTPSRSATPSPSVGAPN